MVFIKDFAENSKQRNLLVFDYGVSSENGRRLDIQLDGRDPVAKGGAGLNPDKNASLRLVDRRTHYKDASGNVQSRFEHTNFYTNGQVDKIKEAAGDKTQTIKLANGNTVDVYGIKADLTQVKKNFTDKDMNKFKAGVLIVDTSKPMTKSDFTVGPKVYENQFENAMKIKDKSAKAYEEIKAQAPEVPAKEAEVETKKVEMDSPEL